MGECGYDLTIFEDQKIIQDYLCSLCLGVLNNPLISPKGCEFCQHCVLEWITAHNNTRNAAFNCPACLNENITKGKLNASKRTRQQIDSFETHCSNSLNSVPCPWKGPRSTVDAHMSSCPVSLIPCNCKTDCCKGQILRRDKELHEKIASLTAQLAEAKSNSFNHKKSPKQSNSVSHLANSVWDSDDDVLLGTSTSGTVATNSYQERSVESHWATDSILSSEDEAVSLEPAVKKSKGLWYVDSSRYSTISSRNNNNCWVPDSSHFDVGSSSVLPNSNKPRRIQVPNVASRTTKTTLPKTACPCDFIVPDYMEDFIVPEDEEKESMWAVSSNIGSTSSARRKSMQTTKVNKNNKSSSSSKNMSTNSLSSRHPALTAQNKTPAIRCDFINCDEKYYRSDDSIVAKSTAHTKGTISHNDIIVSNSNVAAELYSSDDNSDDNFWR